ncbi:MAG: O-antigen ligase family protein [Cyanobacteria bacterium P01_D01_bin.1]
MDNSSFARAHDLPGSVLPSQQTRLDLMEKGFCVFAWLFYSNGIATILDNELTYMRPMRYGIFAVVLLLLLLRWKGTLKAIRKGWLLWPVVGLLVLSSGWTISPAYTTESVRGEVLPTAAFALYFASRFNMREQMRILAVALGIAAVLSLFYAIAIPEIGRHLDPKFKGAWRGIYSQKNNFSTTMTMTMLLFFVLSLLSRNLLEKRISQGALVFSVAMLILSTSKSGLIIFFVMLFVVIAARLFRWRGRRSVLMIDLAGLCFLAAGTVLSQTWQDIVIALGRDPTLSARTYIWTGVILNVARRPLLGYGRAAFWVPDNPLAKDIGLLASNSDYIPAHAHNGFLDVLLEIGIVGFGIFAIGLLLTYGIAIRRAYLANAPEDLWPFTFLTLMVASNMTESVLMQRVTLYWVLYMVLFLSLRIWPAQSTRPNAELAGD